VSTLAEIEVAVEALPRREQEMLYLRLASQLAEEIPTPAQNQNSRLSAFDALQKKMALTSEEAQVWRETLSAARR
jgi:hypothetical protein